MVLTVHVVLAEHPRAVFDLKAREIETNGNTKDYWNDDWSLYFFHLGLIHLPHISVEEHISCLDDIVQLEC